MEDASDVGKYGTIRLLRSREPFSVVATYPIDEEEVTFGRDASCGVRLYYQEVSPVHCKLVFEDRKAFLQVLGTSGIVIDGCPVFPTKPTDGDNTPTTVPLLNGNTFEIFRKRFIFNYPPKSIRPQLFTPATARRKSIRMSLVNSAVVFTPAPSPFPHENLRVLQSPLKISTLDQTVTLVDGNHPRVFEEEQDLVILEDIEEQTDPVSPTPVRTEVLPSLHKQNSPLKTPRRRAAPSLHRAVLIRSAQRVAIMRETQNLFMRAQNQVHQPEFNSNTEDDIDEGEEEEEVSNSILNLSDEEEEDSHLDSTNDNDTEETQEEMLKEPDEWDITEARDEYCAEDIQSEPHYTTPLQVSRTIHFSNSTTPQLGLLAEKPQQTSSNDQIRAGPQRPPPGYIFGSTPGVKEKVESIVEELPVSQPPSPTKRTAISAEERKAILERRKSALKVPEPEIPGLGTRRLSIAPNISNAPASPFKALSADIEKGEDTRSAIKRMEAQLLELRRNSTSPTRPRISKDLCPPSPEKTFSLLSKEGNADSKYKTLKQRMKDEMESFEEEGFKSETSNQSAEPSAHFDTPPLDGLRNIFHISKTAHGIESPAVISLQDMFHAAQDNSSTSNLTGIHHSLTEKSTPRTPEIDSLGDMISLEKDPQQSQENVDKTGSSIKGGSNESLDNDNDCGINDPDVKKSGPVGPGAVIGHGKIPTMTRNLVRSRARRPNLIRSRGTPTDASIMADDETTPDLNTTKSSNQSSNGIPVAAIVHRTTRGRRNITIDSDIADDEATPNLEKQGSKVNSRRGKTSINSGIAQPTKATRKNQRRAQNQQERSSVFSGRNTRSRSRSLDVDGEELVLNRVNVGPSNVGVIHEDEECDISSAMNAQNVNIEGIPSSDSSTISKVDRVTMGSQSSQPNQGIRPLRKIPSVDLTDHDTVATCNKGDKENTPEKSSGSGSNTECTTSRVSKPSSKSRSTVGKDKAAATRTGKSRIAKPSSKTVKVKTEEPTSTLRITRSRTKK